MATNYYFDDDHVRVTPETEVVAEGGRDILEIRHKECEKHPGHLEFHRVSELCLDILPEEIRTLGNLDLIKKKSNQTVKIKISYTSENRPLRYPFHEHRGSRREARFGTGAINRVLSWEPIKQPCPCHECIKPEMAAGPMKEHYLFTIRTATHVVFDESEAREAVVDCFFDTDDTKDPRIKRLYGVSLDGTNTTLDKMNTSDVCELICATHDEETARIVREVVEAAGLPAGVPRMNCHALPPEGVIVSHPHGCSKRITFGKIRNVKVPVKPLYEILKPMPLPSATKCRLNLRIGEDVEGAAHLGAYAEDYTAMLKSITELAQEDETRTVNRLSKLLSPLTSHTTPKERPGNERSTDKGAKPTNQVEDIVVSETSVRDACVDFFDSTIQQDPFPSEFGHTYVDTNGMLDSLNQNRQNSSSNPTNAPIDLANAWFPFVGSVLQSSKALHHEGETITNENASSRRDRFADFVITNCRMLGIEDEIVQGVAGLMKNVIPAISDGSMPVDQKQGLWGDLFTNAFRIANRYGSNDTGVNVGGGGGECGGGGGKSGGSGDGEIGSGVAEETNGARSDGGSASGKSSGGGSGGVGDSAGTNGRGEASGGGSGCGGCTDGGNDNDNCGFSTQNAQPNNTPQKTPSHNRSKATPSNNTPQPTLSNNTPQETPSNNTPQATSSNNTPQATPSNNDTPNENTTNNDTPNDNTTNNDTPNENLTNNEKKPTADKVRMELINDIISNQQTTLGKCHPETIKHCEGIIPTNSTIKSLYQSLLPQENTTPDEDFTLPYDLRFILPSGAPYAMIYNQESPGWFSFPPGTKLSVSEGRDVTVAEGTEFSSGTFLPLYCKVTHTIPTCKGSSGSTIYCGLLGGGRGDVGSFFPHFGKTEEMLGELVINESGTQEIIMSGGNNVVVDSLNRAVLGFTTDKIDEALSLSVIDFDLD